MLYHLSFENFGFVQFHCHSRKYVSELGASHEAESPEATCVDYHGLSKNRMRALRDLVLQYNWAR